MTARRTTMAVPFTSFCACDPEHVWLRDAEDTRCSGCGHPVPQRRIPWLAVLDALIEGVMVVAIAAVILVSVMGLTP